ncbi:MAG: hypothetical protein Q9175_001311 [Cornicularia normoerica]
MLGVLRMDIDTCISKYLDMAPKVFPEEGFVSGSRLGKLFKGVRGEARFDANDLEKVVKEMVSGTFLDQGEDTLLQTEQIEQDQSQCRTFVCVTNKDVGKPFRLRNYRSAWEPGTGCTIWQAARATSAAPLYFPPIRFGNPPANYVDGGFNYNNPIRSLYDEARYVWGKSHREIKCIVSIGTGIPSLKATGDTGKQILKSVVAIATDTQTTADGFADEMEHLAENAKIDYFRLNVDRGLEKMKLEEWKDFDTLTGATSYYLNSHKADLDRCANALLDSDSSGKSQDSCSVVLSELPSSSNAFFGRVAELSQLRTIMSFQAGETRRQRAVLWGLGGFGKTRLALEYLRIHQKDYAAVLWINAATYESAEESFVQAAIALRSRHALPPGLPAVGARTNMRLVQQWLASSKNKDWLMILDSLDDLESFDCRDLVPQCSHGSIVVTSILSDTMEALDFQGLEIGGLDLVHGCEMLLFGVSVEASSDKAMSLISGDLSEILARTIKAMGGMPLAIEQARAMIKQGITVQSFLRHFETQYQRTMTHKPARSAWDYKKNMSIISTFNMLLTRLDEDGDAENILAFASCFGPRPIAVNLMGQTNQAKASTVSSRSRWYEVQHTREMSWLNRFEHDRLAFQIATWQLESLCLLKMKRDNEGSIVSISLHDSIRRWRFETLTGDTKERWIIAAAYALSKCLPKDIVDQASQLKDLPLIRHFHSIMRRHFDPQKLEAPDGEFCHQYGYLMAQFAHLYLDSGYTVEGEYMFSQAIGYQRILQESSWPKDRRSLLLLKGLAMMFSKNGKMEDAAETTKILYDASMKLLNTGDEITSWAAARLPVVRERKIRYAEDGQRAVIASRGEKMSSTTPARTTNEIMQAVYEDERLNRVSNIDPECFGFTALRSAALTGNVKDIRRELDRGVDVNARDGQPAAALLLASQSGHDAVVQLLLDHGADVNLKGRFCGTALAAASYEGHTAVVEMLLSHGADVNARDLYYGTALQCAARNGHHTVAQLLLNNKADVNAWSDYHGPALHEASRRGHTAMVEMLLSMGADVNATDGSCGTALHEASYQGHIAVVEILLNHGASINDQNAKYRTALHEAINDQNEKYGTALHEASRQGHTAVAQILLNNEADVKLGDERHGTALWIAVFNNRYNMVKLLLANGADVNAKDSTFGTALQEARLQRLDEMIELLMAAGARDDI